LKKDIFISIIKILLEIMRQENNNNRIAKLRIERLEKSRSGRSLCYIDQQIMSELTINTGDIIEIRGLKDFAPDKPLILILHHSDGTYEQFQVSHSYNQKQIEWFKAGSALNLISQKA